MPGWASEFVYVGLLVSTLGAGGAALNVGQERILDSETLGPALRLDMYRRMRVIRRFEEVSGSLYSGSEIPGFLHLSIGQEAVPVGVCAALRPGDVITSTHRGHGHCIAKGLPLREMFAELMGKGTGVCGGLGGSMHIADPTLGVLGANGIVGAGIPIAVGAALSLKVRATGSVAVAFFGEGALGQGYFHEAACLASLWQVPVLFLCESNGFAEFSETRVEIRGSTRDKARAYGLEYDVVDGNDVIAVAAAASAAIKAVRDSLSPRFLECRTLRARGHYEGDPQKYRSPDLEELQVRDPVTRMRETLLAGGVSEAELDDVDQDVEREIATAVTAARADSTAPLGRVFEAVSAEDAPLEVVPMVDSGEFRVKDAVRAAIEVEMRANDLVYLTGIDVVAGNVFALFRGLVDEFPGRVLDSSISEGGLVGSAIGAAVTGLRPIVEVMYLDFVGVCFDALMNQLAKFRFMSGGKITVPVVIRTQFGAGKSSGSQHSQSLEALLAHIPGLIVVMPSSPSDAYGLMRSALMSSNPVVYVENRHLYGLIGTRPQADYFVPLGHARVVREGTDVTVVSYSRMVLEAVAACDLLAEEGISVEVIDLRTIVPVDYETILSSVAKTSRLVVAHEAVEQFGVGAEICAWVGEHGFWHLDSPILRVGAPATPVPYAAPLEAEWLPGKREIVDAVRRAVSV